MPMMMLELLKLLEALTVVFMMGKRSMLVVGR
jgi:hypothetical protein